MAGATGDAEAQGRSQYAGSPADVPALQAEVTRLERDLESLAAIFDRLWYASPGDETPPDLQAGARLHHEIVARLVQLEAARAALAHANTLADSPQGPAR
jgi:hypothetical protein